MDQPTTGSPLGHGHDSCSCGGGCCGHMCGHHGWGKFSLLRVLLGLVFTIIVFALGFGLGRISGFEHFGRGGNMMYYRTGMPMMQGQYGNSFYYSPGPGMMRNAWPTATSTPTK